MILNTFFLSNIFSLSPSSFSHCRLHPFSFSYRRLHQISAFPVKLLTYFFLSPASSFSPDRLPPISVFPVKLLTYFFLSPASSFSPDRLPPNSAFPVNSFSCFSIAFRPTVICLFKILVFSFPYLIINLTNTF